MGWNVVLKQPVGPKGLGTSDLYVKETQKVWEIYSPTTSNSRQAISELNDKAGRQSPNVILDLTDPSCNIKVSDLGDINARLAGMNKKLNIKCLIIIGK